MDNIKKYISKINKSNTKRTTLSEISSFFEERILIVGLLMLVLLFSIPSGCAYYNHFYNAKKHFSEAEKSRKEQTTQTPTRRQRTGVSAYDKSIESAGRMIEIYPNSKWEAEALLLMAKASYWTDRYRQAIGKLDELLAKYPQSELNFEGQLWKGMSLLRIPQPDSARAILNNYTLPNVPLNLRIKAHYALGDYYYNENRYELAIEEFRAILTSGTSDEWVKGESLLKIGESLKKLQQYESAIELYTEILRVKIPRDLRFEIELQRAIARREIGDVERALSELENLLRDGAFIDQFPRVELQIAKCEAQLGMAESAKHRLEALIESERRTPIAAEAQYELGILLWENWRDLKNSRTALSSVRQIDRNSPLVAYADSISEVATILSGYWYRNRFLDAQIASIDSALSGLKKIFPDDTVFVDSIKLITDERASAAGRRRTPSTPSRGGRISQQREPSPQDPLQRMVDEAMEKDSAKENEKKKNGVPKEDAPVDTSFGFNEQQLMQIDSLRKTELLNLRLEIGGYFMVELVHFDSAKYYFDKCLPFIDEGERWSKITASLAYIARNQGDRELHDSYYSEILERYPEGAFANSARIALGLDPIPEKLDSAQVLLRIAEEEWKSGDPRKARDIYLQIAELVDSTSTDRARALLAAAHLTLRSLGDDSLAVKLYSKVNKEFPRTDFAKVSTAKLSHKSLQQLLPKEEAKIPIEENKKESPSRKKAPREPVYEEESYEDPFRDPYFDDGFMFEHPYEEDEIVYMAADVDEIPTMRDEPMFLKSLQRNYFPFEAISQDIRGVVEIEFKVSRFGMVSDANVVFEEPEDYGFGSAALQVLERLSYNPGRHRGMPVSVILKQRFVFDPEE